MTSWMSTGTRSEKSDYHNNACKRLRDLLLGVLQGSRRADFEIYLQQALGMDTSDSSLAQRAVGRAALVLLRQFPQFCGS